MREMIRKMLKLAVLVMLCLLCAGTVMAADRYEVRYHEKSHMYFLYKNGHPAQNSSTVAVRIPRTEVNTRVFDGVYLAAASGRLNVTPGVVYLPQDQKVEGVTYRKGWYKAEANGRLASRKGIMEVSRRTVNGKTFDGIYYHEKTGRFADQPIVCNLNLTYRNVKYNGYYYFGGVSSKLGGESGLVKWNNSLYYVLASSGRCLVSQKRNIKGKVYEFDSRGVGRLLTVDMASLRTQLTAITRRYGGTWSIYVKKLDSNQSFTVNNQPHYAASVIKPFIMATIYEQVKEGKKKLTAADTSNLWYMITESSNDASNELGISLGSGNFLKGAALVNAYNKREGYLGTQLHHTFHPSYINRIGDGSSNCATAADCGRLLEKIYRGTCVNPASSQKMLDALLHQQRRWKIPAGLPAGTKVANKTGENISNQHDMAIVYGPKCDYILCVMSSGVTEYSGIECIKEISSAVYKSLER